MSRVGKVPIALPDGVQVSLGDGEIRVKGPQGELTHSVPSGVKVKEEERQLIIERESDVKDHRALHGLTRALVANMVTGVSQGFEKRLELVGVGYRVAKKGENLEIQIGFSHPVKVEAPSGIKFEVPAPDQLTVRGIDRQAVGQVAAEIRAIRKPEPYKGKGFRYAGEYVRKKAGKAAKVGAG